MYLVNRDLWGRLLKGRRNSYRIGNCPQKVCAKYSTHTRLCGFVYEALFKKVDTYRRISCFVRNVVSWKKRKKLLSSLTCKTLMARFTKNSLYCQKILQEAWSCHMKVHFVNGLVGGNKKVYQRGLRKKIEFLLTLYYISCKNMPKNGNLGSKYFRNIMLRKESFEWNVVSGRCATVKSHAGFCRNNNKT